MVHKLYWPRPTLYLHSLMCILFAILFLAAMPQHVFAQSISASMVRTAADGPTFQVRLGFSSRFRDGNWTPVHVALQNTGSDFTGSISINVPTQFAGTNNPDTTAIYRTPITLPTGAQKQVTIYAPFSFGTPGTAQNVTVALLDANRQKVGPPQAVTLHALQSSDFFVGVLSDSSTGFGSLSGLSLPQQPSSVIVEALNATTMPGSAAALDNFNLLVLDNFNTSTLSAAQLDALQHWVNQGGTLVIAGGPEWRRTTAPLPSGLVPVTLTNTTTVPAGTQLVPTGSFTKQNDNAKDVLQSPVTISTAKAIRGTVLLASGANPLLVQAQSGQGNVFYMAFDPTLDPIVGWSGASSLWRGILLRTLGDQVLTQSQNQSNGNPVGVVGPSKAYSQNITNVLQSLLPNIYPSIWLILILLLSYILVLGPLRLLLVRRLKKRDWSWRIAVATIVVFSLLTYGFALQQKGTTIINDSISLVQLGDSTTPNANAHITTYLGVFVPSQGDFQVRVPGESLVQPNEATSQFQPTTSSKAPTTITPRQNGTDVNLQGVDIWTLRSIVSERDRQLQGNITSHLTVTNGLLAGTVTNSLSYNLDDVDVLIGNQYVSLGQLGAGQTQHIHLSLSSPSLNNYPPQPLASQIASDHGQPSSYGPNNGGQVPQNEAQRHLSILSSFGNANNGNTNCNANGTCYQANGGPSQTLFQDYDPLTIANAPATLIGWANPQSDLATNVTINGNHSSGQQEILVRAPLAVSFTGALTLPPSFMKGQLIDVQGTSAQSISPGVYTMGTGSMTYEYTVPGASQIRASTLAVGQVANMNQTVSPPNNGQPFVDANHLQVKLYNWKTNAWDNFTFNQYMLSVKDVPLYVGSGGRILVQLANTDSSSATIVFNKPLLQIQGTL